jgi:hypothetical protein
MHCPGLCSQARFLLQLLYNPGSLIPERLMANSDAGATWEMNLAHLPIPE